MNITLCVTALHIVQSGTGLLRRYILVNQGQVYYAGIPYGICIFWGPAPTLPSFFTLHDHRVISKFLHECFAHECFA